MRKLKKENTPRYDALTEKVQNLLNQIPRVGSYFARLYLWRAMMFNFMLVGATGLILSWVLYELGFRVLFVDVWNLPGGSFLGMMVTTTIVFGWNYVLNKKFSLNITAQIGGMKREQLEKLRNEINRLLSGKRSDAK